MRERLQLSNKSRDLAWSSREKSLYLKDAEEYFCKKNSQIVKNHAIKVKQEMREVTGKPKLISNSVHKSLKRSIEDLYQWEKQKNHSRAFKASQKRLAETVQQISLQSSRLVSPKSHKLADKKRHLGERIEDRLLREGKAIEHRKQKLIRQEERKYGKSIALLE